MSIGSCVSNRYFSRLVFTACCTGVTGSPLGSPGDAAVGSKGRVKMTSAELGGGGGGAVDDAASAAGEGAAAGAGDAAVGCQLTWEGPHEH